MVSPDSAFFPSAYSLVFLPSYILPCHRPNQQHTEGNHTSKMYTSTKPTSTFSLSQAHLWTAAPAQDFLDPSSQNQDCSNHSQVQV